MAKKNSSSEPKKTESRALLALLWIGLPSLLVGLLALGLGFWPMPTRVQIDLQARSMEFTAAKDSSLSPDVGFRSLEVDGFQHAVFSPQRLRLPGSPGLQSFKEQTFELFGGVFPRARLVVETPARLTSLNIQAGTRVVVSASKQQVQLKWPESPQSLQILINQPLRLYATHVHKQSQEAPRESDLRLDAELRDVAPLLKIKTIVGGNLSLALPGKESLELLGGKPLLVTRIEFQQQDDSGFPSSTLAGIAKVRYTDYPKLAEKNIEPKKLFNITPIDDTPLTLTALRLDSDQGILSVSLSGRVGRLWSGRDYRLTWLDGLWNDALTMLVFTIVAWTCTVSVGIYKLYREINKS